MIRLHEFITKIRNCKTMAEERAEYQKEMAAIRESFARNEENLRPRNLTKLLFINMSGQDTNFGQMECLNLITGKSPIQKRIGYLGLTQLFHEKSELLMMATNRIKIDLTSTNSNVIGLALCVVSEVCTIELARELQGEILKCIENKSNYIKKKAILTAIKLIKKCPEFISEYLPKVIESLETKNHGVLLSCMAFFENVIVADQGYLNKIVSLAPKFTKIYRYIHSESNSDYSINGAQDPFLQVAILSLMKTLKKTTNSSEISSALLDIVISVNDGMSGSLGALKNGPKAILYECFQCSVLLESSPKLKKIIEDMLTKFVSTKDANSKYLSLINLSLMAKNDINMAKNYKGVIIECLGENDILIQSMALDLLYIIACPDNVTNIIKDLLNVLLSAVDEEFISELALKVCLIVEKHSESRRWQFDTILKVLVLADQSVKEDTSRSLVHLVMSTPQLQKYCLAKLFFSTCENTQNDALCRITLYLLGELAHILPKIPEVEVTEETILTLFEQILFRATVEFDTICYGLSALMKMYDKFPRSHQKIKNMIKVFESHCDLEVQKRACEYSKLLKEEWDDERRREISIPVPSFQPSAEAFGVIPIGDTTLELDVNALKMPEKVDVNYAERVSEIKPVNDHVDSRTQKPREEVYQKPVEQVRVPEKKKVQSLLDDDDDVVQVKKPVEKPIEQPKKVVQNDDPFGILDLDIGEPNPPAHNQGGFGNIDFSQPTTVNNPPQEVKKGGGDLLDDDFLGLNMNQPPVQNPVNFNQNPTMNQNLGFNFNQPPVQNPVTQPPQITLEQPKPVQPETHKFKGFENEHLQIWYEARKEGADKTSIRASFMNKTHSYIDGINIQTAVMKYLQIAISSLNTNALPANSKGGVYQNMTVTNSAVGQKAIVMKIRLSYMINGRNVNAEAKIEGFPMGF